MAACCGSTSCSEPVPIRGKQGRLPLLRADGTLLGVWDADSPERARFDDDDRIGMEALCADFMRAVDNAE